MREADFASHRWRDPAWRGEALAWADAHLAALGRPRTGDVEQVRSYAWSTVLRLATSDGAVWFKANAVGTAHEGPLLAALARWAPGHVLRPLAVDLRRGWLLLPDGGTTLRAAQGGHTDAAHWAEILADHAELQRTVAPHADAMVALGVPDVRPARLPAIRADLLDDTVALRIGRPGGLTPDQRDRLCRDATRYAAVCEELAATGVPASLQHDDLHDNNVFVPGPAGGHYRVFDWGDASVAHPFGLLLVALRVVADRHHLPYGDPQLLRLRDAYLEPWTGDFDRPTLVEAARLASRVGGVSRALCYRSALLEGDTADHDDQGDGVPQWLLEVYEPTPLDPAGWP
ncbi:MAG: aminoglycoside phosphotransferase family protein [Actinomycetes bacterium]